MSNLLIPWFKYEVTFELDSRFIAISRQLNMRLALVSDFWTKLMVFARRSSHPGVIEDFDFERMRVCTDFVDDEIQALLDAFATRKMLKVSILGDCITVILPKWDDNQGVTDGAKYKRDYRARKKAAQESTQSDVVEKVPNVEELLGEQADGHENTVSLGMETPKKPRRYQNKYNINYSPELIEQAEQVYRHYDNTIQPPMESKSKSSAINNICKRIKDAKISAEDLIAATNNYKSIMDTKDPTEPKFPYAAHNFFGFMDGKKYMDNYLPEVFAEVALTSIKKKGTEWVALLTDEEKDAFDMEVFGKVFTKSERTPQHDGDNAVYGVLSLMEKNEGWKFPDKYKKLKAEDSLCLTTITVPPQN